MDFELKRYLLLTIPIGLVLGLVPDILPGSIRLFPFISNSIKKLSFKHNFKISVAMLHASSPNIHEHVLHSTTKRIHDNVWQCHFRGRQYVSNRDFCTDFYFFYLKTGREYYYDDSKVTFE